jgi:hypothetical protein
MASIPDDFSLSSDGWRSEPAGRLLMIFAPPSMETDLRILCKHGPQGYQSSYRSPYPTFGATIATSVSTLTFLADFSPISIGTIDYRIPWLSVGGFGVGPALGSRSDRFVADGLEEVAFR